MEYYAETNKKQERSQWTAIVKDQKNVYTKEKECIHYATFCIKKEKLYI